MPNDQISYGFRQFVPNLSQTMVDGGSFLFACNEESLCKSRADGKAVVAVSLDKVWPLICEMKGASKKIFSPLSLSPSLSQTSCARLQPFQSNITIMKCVSLKHTHWYRGSVTLSHLGSIFWKLEEKGTCSTIEKRCHALLIHLCLPCPISGLLFVLLPLKWFWSIERDFRGVGMEHPRGKRGEDPYGKLKS